MHRCVKPHWFQWLWARAVGVQRWFRPRIVAKYGRPACFQLDTMKMEGDWNTEAELGVCQFLKFLRNPFPGSVPLAAVQCRQSRKDCDQGTSLLSGGCRGSHISLLSGGSVFTLETSLAGGGCVSYGIRALEGLQWHFSILSTSFNDSTWWPGPKSSTQSQKSGQTLHVCVQEARGVLSSHAVDSLWSCFAQTSPIPQLLNFHRVKMSF